MKITLQMLVLIIIISGLTGSFSTFIMLNMQTPSKNALIKEYYDVENAVLVSPHSLRKMMDKGDQSFILVDLRSQQEYENEHIIGAINIPAYKDPNTSAYDEVDRIALEFSKLPKDKDIIVYCYSIPCMTGRKIGKMLADKGIYVKVLGIGWNEWRYYWTLWNHELEWNATVPADYIARGKEPGRLKNKGNSTACPISGSLGC